MLEDGALWRWITDALQIGHPAVLVVVADHSGSSPGRTGAKMVVSDDVLLGSVGGGALEHAAIHQARGLSNTLDSTTHYRRYVHASGNIEASGAMCGGEQYLVFHRCRIAELQVFQRLAMGETQVGAERLLITANGVELSSDSSRINRPRFELGPPWRYLESLVPRREAYIIGAGHVGQALASVLRLLNFEIILIDERPPDVLKQHLALEQNYRRLAYRDIAQSIPDGIGRFAFVMTHSHHCDEVVCAQLLAKDLAYVGVLGSTHKLAHLRSALAKRLPDSFLKRLHAPMGLPIGSHTPAEIAVSIAAEIVRDYDERR